MDPDDARPRRPRIRAPLPRPGRLWCGAWSRDWGWWVAGWLWTVLPWAWLAEKTGALTHRTAAIHLVTAYRDGPALTAGAGAAAALLGLAMVWQSRRQGTLPALSGSVRRRTILRRTLLFGTLTLLGAHGLIGAGLGWMATTAGHPAWVPAILLHAALSLTWALATFVTALAAGTVAPAFGLAALLVAVWAMLPLFLAAAVNALAIPAPPPLPVSGPAPSAPGWAVPVIGILAALTPFAHLPPRGGPTVGTLLGGLAGLCWALLVAHAVGRWWDRLPIEQPHGRFLFPVLWNVVYAVAASLVGVVVVDAVDRGRVHAYTVPLFGTVFLLAWLVARRLIRPR
jgi:hypothetical protein